MLDVNPLDFPSPRNLIPDCSQGPAPCPELSRTRNDSRVWRAQTYLTKPFSTLTQNVSQNLSTNKSYQRNE